MKANVLKSDLKSWLGYRWGKLQASSQEQNTETERNANRETHLVVGVRLFTPLQTETEQKTKYGGEEVVRSSTDRTVATQRQLDTKSKIN